MGYEVKVILDSVAPSGCRLTTITARYPRFIHSEVLTHRDRERNSASSRAIPFPKLCEMVLTEPVVPIRWGSEQKGMQTGAEVDGASCELAEAIWLEARDKMVGYAESPAKLGIHKSLCNRLLEPWMWITVVMTATEWRNFFRLRCHSDAEIHFQRIAGMIRDALAESVPNQLPHHHWHTPFIQQDEEKLPLDTKLKASVARCARVSYLTHEGTRDTDNDMKLFDRLVNGSGFGHWSPHGHVAQAAMRASTRSGPFRGWFQYRKRFPNENVEG